MKDWLAPGASVTLGGETLTTTCGMIVMALLALVCRVRLADRAERHRVRRRHAGRRDVIDAAGIGRRHGLAGIRADDADLPQRRIASRDAVDVPDHASIRRSFALVR